MDIIPDQAYPKETIPVNQKPEEKTYEKFYFYWLFFISIYPLTNSFPSRKENPDFTEELQYEQ